jgi:D-tyrosyl-tRNA(Tyr) deacylase
MARTAITELQQQIEEVRRQAFAAGYAAAMQAVRELASRPAAGAAATVQRQRRAGGGRKPTATTPPRGHRGGARQGAGRPRRSAASRPQRGTNAQTIEEILQAAAPRALRQAEIRQGLKDKGIEVAFTSIRHALGQLEARNAAEQVGSTKTWRHRSGP